MNLLKIIMVKNMNKNKIILFLTFIGAILIIVLPTTIKIYQNHMERLYEVATKKILESAEECYQKQICTEPKITIGDLKEKGFLKEDVVNPKTKQVFDDSMFLEEKNFKVTFFNN